jgi:hypothetical protein
MNFKVTPNASFQINCKQILVLQYYLPGLFDVKSKLFARNQIPREKKTFEILTIGYALKSLPTVYGI